MGAALQRKAYSWRSNYKYILLLIGCVIFFSLVSVQIMQNSQRIFQCYGLKIIVITTNRSYLNAIYT